MKKQDKLLRNLYKISHNLKGVIILFLAPGGSLNWQKNTANRPAISLPFTK